MFFNPANWFIDQKVLIRAQDDSEVEGPHSSGVDFKVESNDDPRYNLVTTERTVSIIDNDCDVLSLPTRAVYIVGECDGVAATCTIQCMPGYTPGDDPGGVPLSCDPDKDAYLPVNRSRAFPTCADCADGYFLAGGVCARCSTNIACPAGQYRGVCGETSDADCLACIVQSPHSHFSAPSQPPTNSECPWECVEQYNLNADGVCKQVCPPPPPTHTHPFPHSSSLFPPLSPSPSHSTAVRALTRAKSFD